MPKGDDVGIDEVKSFPSRSQGLRDHQPREHCVEAIQLTRAEDAHQMSKCEAEVPALVTKSCQSQQRQREVEKNVGSIVKCSRKRSRTALRDSDRGKQMVAAMSSTA